MKTLGVFFRKKRKFDLRENANEVACPKWTVDQVLYLRAAVSFPDHSFLRPRKPQTRVASDFPSIVAIEKRVA
jgi:hypothetical protein